MSNATDAFAAFAAAAARDSETPHSNHETPGSASGDSASGSVASTSASHEATIKLKPDDVIDAFVRLAEEEGHTKDNDAAFVVNIGSPTDSAMYYRLAIAITDYVYFKLRKALGENRMDVLTWNNAREALHAAGISPTGKSKYVTECGDLAHRIDAARHTASDAIRDLVAISDSLPTELRERMKRSLSILGITDVAAAEVQSEHPLHDDDARCRLEKFIDDFQRFTSLGEGGRALMEVYEQMAFELFHIVPGQEQGYVVICAKTRMPDESKEAYMTRQRSVALELVKKIKQRMSGFPQLSRISLHQAYFGEVIPMGYVPEERDVVTIDSDGIARTILSVSEHGLGQMKKTDDQVTISALQAVLK